MIDSISDIKVLVAGAPKSGTTALFYQIKDSLVSGTIGVFEPKSNNDIQQKVAQHKPLIAKIVLTYTPDYKFLQQFDRIILIARDPRDILISSLLYHGAYHSVYNRSREEIQKVFELLQKKEENPSAISIRQIWDHTMDETFPVKELRERLRRMIAFAQNLDCHVSHYEDFVQGKITDLEQYLGFELIKEAKVPTNLQRVTRTKKAGNWRNWFTPQDIDFYKPYFLEMMEFFDYDTQDWELNSTPKILNNHCSEYYLRLINERRKGENLKQIQDPQSKKQSFLDSLLDKFKR